MNDRERWIPVGPSTMPEPGQAVDWISPGGDVIEGGKFHGGAIWFLPGGGMYVYYTPTYWRPHEHDGEGT